jgi:O-antigen/teichoic acid export membrane protein
VNALFKVASSAANFALVPVFLRVYGIVDYGAFSLLLAISQYLGVLDFGLTGSLVQEAAGLRSRDSSYFVLRRFAVLSLLWVGGVVVSVAALTAPLWGSLVGLEHVRALGVGVLGAGVLATLQIVSGAYNSRAVAELRFFFVNVVNLVRNILPQLVAATTYAVTRDLSTALLAAGASAAAIVLVQRAILKRDEPRSRSTIARVSLGTGWAFLGRSLTFSLQSLLAVLLMPTLQAAVGAGAGSAANALVDIGRRVLFAGRQVIEAMFVPLFPLTSRMSVAGDRTGVLLIAIRGTGFASLLAVGYYTAMRFALPALLPMLVGSVTHDVLPVALVLLHGVAWTIPGIAMYQTLSSSTRGRAINVAGAAASLFLMGPAFSLGSAGVTRVLYWYSAACIVGALIVVVGGGAYLAGWARGGRTNPCGRHDA